MTFDQFVKDVLADAAPQKYPVIIEKDAFAVEALHDDYVDLKFGSITFGKAVALTDYVRSIRFADIKSIQPMKDWHFIHIPAAMQPHNFSTLSADEVETRSPGFLDALKAILKDQEEGQ